MSNLKIGSSCNHCFFDDGMGSDAPTVEFELTDGNFYPWTCSRGHENHLILANKRFELLLEIGLRAARDGYPREFVVAFAGALERFYEFALRVLMQAESVDAAVRFRNFNALWKQVRKHSERQMGAFQAIWLNSFDQQPAMLDPNDVSFRNNVVHNGLIPSKADAIAFCQAAYDAIFDNGSVLLDKRRRAVEWVGHVANFEAGREAVERKKIITTITLVTPFSLILAPELQVRANIAQLVG